jgi:hypothetical protein
MLIKRGFPSDFSLKFRQRAFSGSHLDDPCKEEEASSPKKITAQENLFQVAALFYGPLNAGMTRP